MTTPKIAWPSAASRRLLLLSNQHSLGTATGFVAELAGEPYLVTNRHVLAGRDERNQPRHKSGAVPDTCHVLHNVAGALGAWQGRDEPLHDDDGLPLWLEHPQFGREVDVVALPLRREPGLAFYSYVLDAPEPYLATRVAQDVSIVGFPFGL